MSEEQQKKVQEAHNKLVQEQKKLAENNAKKGEHDPRKLKNNFAIILIVIAALAFAIWYFFFR